MIRGFIISFFVALFLVACSPTNTENVEVRQEGLFSNYFARQRTAWAKHKRVKLFSVNAYSQKSILIEWGSVNFKDYNYMFIDALNGDMTYYASDRKIDRRLSVVELRKLNEVLKKVGPENRLFDGTATTKDGIIYFLTFRKNKEVFKLGSYDLVRGPNYSSAHFGDIASKNISIIRQVISFNR
jgi:hypothetical protein